MWRNGEIARGHSFAMYLSAIYDKYRLSIGHDNEISFSKLQTDRIGPVEIKAHLKSDSHIPL